MQAVVKPEILGQSLVREGRLSEKELQIALQHRDLQIGQADLAQVLVQLGFCQEEDVSRVLAKLAGIAFVSLESYPVDPNAIATISPEAARRYRALPISFTSSGALVVAAVKPLARPELEDLRLLTGCQLQIVLITNSDFEATMRNFGLAGVKLTIKEEGVNQYESEPTVYLLPEDSEEPAVQLANTILLQAVNAKASDIHIEVFEQRIRVRFRIDGVLHDVFNPPWYLHRALVARFKIMANLNIAERRLPQDGRMSIQVRGKTIDVRVATMPVGVGERVTLRLLERTENLLKLEQLGVTATILAQYRKLLSLPYGFIPVTGPTGSGKSTTLYASLMALDSVRKNIITIEDPVEYRLEGINQIQINTKAGLTFASGLRAILRNDPDILMVGEIRDRETAAIAIEAALTGHLVFTTLHTNDAASAISRLTEMGVEPYLVASSVVGILAQRLARLLCSYCKEEYTLTRQEAESTMMRLGNEEKLTLFRPRSGGCLHCNYTGYAGRIGIFELLLVSEKIQKLAVARAPSGEIKRQAVAEGMVTLLEDGLSKVKQGLTSLEEVMRVVV
ncbi:MAG: Flp pilus assembly complex ATPase component TadA [Firmicutes bacterium]|nr:Flp pilus assembly complex ATPase component TadA [Bacillota bacterium]